MGAETDKNGEHAAKREALRTSLAEAENQAEKAARRAAKARAKAETAARDVEELGMKLPKSDAETEDRSDSDNE